MKSLLLIIGIIFFAYFLGPTIIDDPTFVVGGAIAVVFLFLAFTNFELGLLMLLFVIPFSSQQNLGKFAGGAPVDVGTDDFFIVLMFFVWLVYLAKTKQAPFVKNPLTGPFFAFLMACLISFVPMIVSKRGVPLLSFLHLVKWYEYVFLYFVVVKSIQTREQVVRFTVMALVSAVLVSAIQVFQLMTGQFEKYATAAFESNGILGAFYAFFLAIVVSFWLLTPRRERIWAALLVASGLLSFTLFFAFSRAAVLAMVGSLTLLGILHRKKLMLFSILALLALPVFTSDVISKELSKTVTTIEGKDFRKGGYTILSKRHGQRFELDLSSRERLITWRKAQRYIVRNPVFGIGYWATRYVRAFNYNTLHNFYLTILLEMGAVGLLSFLWLSWALIKNCVQLGKYTSDPFYRSLAYGVGAGYFGILIHCTFGETFESFRLTGPLWIMCGITFAAKRIEEESSELSQTQTPTQPQPYYDV